MWFLVCQRGTCSVIQKRTGLPWHRVQSCPQAVQVRVTPPYCILYSQYDKTLLPACSAGQEENISCTKPNFICTEIGVRPAHAHIQNLNQIFSQSSGINATLHLTLKWDIVVLMDYRWLIMGWHRLWISLEIHLHLILLISIYLPVLHSILLPLHSAPLDGI